MGEWSDEETEQASKLLDLLLRANEDDRLGIVLNMLAGAAMRGRIHGRAAGYAEAIGIVDARVVENRRKEKLWAQSGDTRGESISDARANEGEAIATLLYRAIAPTKETQ